jgi:ubiquinone/menaquinone biosynthesis C-methylase UbiE
MTTKSPEVDLGSVFSSAEFAEEWQSRKTQRDRVNAAANERLLELANLRPGSRVLDVAAGTGDQTLMAAERVGPTGHVLATDISVNMLKLASEAAREAGLRNVETRVIDADDIDLDESSFDAVICRQGLMFFANPGKALAAMHRAVRPQGKVVALVWSTEKKNPYLGIPFAIVRRIGNMPAPAAGQPGMFALAEPGGLERLFRAAGFRDVASHSVPLLRRFASTEAAVESVKTHSILRQMMTKLSETEREQVWAEINRELRQFAGPSGGIELTGEVLIGAGTK